MQLQLICSDNIKQVLEELLNSRGISIDDNAQICLVQRGEELPITKVGIVFDTASLNSLLELLNRLVTPSDHDNRSIVGKADDERYELIPYHNISCFEGRGNSVYCIAENGEFRTKEKLYELENKLPVNRFFRVSKSYIVNISSVKEIIPWFGGRLILRFNNCSKEVEVSRNQVKGFKKFLDM